MSSSVNLNRVLNSKKTSATIFTVACVGKIFHDYRKAPQDEKKDVLAKESTILASSALGMFFYSSAKNTIKTSKITSKIVDSAKRMNKKINKNINQTAKKVINDGTEILKNCIDNLSLLAFGILGGITADELMASKYIRELNKKFEKQSKEIINSEEINQKTEKHRETKQLSQQKNIIFSDFKKKLEGKNIQTYIESDTSKNIVSNISNIPEVKIFSNTMVGLQTLQITEEKTLRAKMKKMTSDLMSNTLLPLFFMSTASVLTKTMKTKYRVPIVLGTMVAGPILIQSAEKKISQNREKEQNTQPVLPEKSLVIDDIK